MIHFFFSLSKVENKRTYYNLMYITEQIYSNATETGTMLKSYISFKVRNKIRV